MATDKIKIVGTKIICVPHVWTRKTLSIDYNRKTDKIVKTVKQTCLSCGKSKYFRKEVKHL